MQPGDRAGAGARAAQLAVSQLHAGVNCMRTARQASLCGSLRCFVESCACTEQEAAPL